VLFHPEYAYGGVGLFGSDHANFVFNVVSSSAVAAKDNPLIADTLSKNLRLGMPDIATPWPLVYACLGWASWASTPDGKSRTPATSPIQISALSRLAGRVDELLGDKPGTRSPQVL